jgi:hypothetical protein
VYFLGKWTPFVALPLVCLPWRFLRLTLGRVLHSWTLAILANEPPRRDLSRAESKGINKNDFGEHNAVLLLLQLLPEVLSERPVRLLHFERSKGKLYAEQIRILSTERNAFVWKIWINLRQHNHSDLFHLSFCNECYTFVTYRLDSLQIRHQSRCATANMYIGYELFAFVGSIMGLRSCACGALLVRSYVVRQSYLVLSSTI